MMEPKILVPIDDSATAQATINTITSLKEQFPKKITLLYVINTDQLAYKMIPDFHLEMVKENAKKAGKLILDRIEKQLIESGFTPESLLEFGVPRSTITNIANNDDFQLIVIGRHEGSGEIRDVLFGSVANYVLHNAKCPVLLF